MPAPIFGELSTGEASGMVIIAGVVGGALTKAFDYVLQFSSVRQKQRTEDRKASREDRDESLTRMENLLNRVERQLESAQRENERLRVAANRATVRAERAVVWIKHLEARLKDNDIPFDAWTDAAQEAEPHGPPGRGDAETDAEGGYP